MIKKYSVYMSIILISILITNCSIKTDLTDKDLEERFYFKGTSKLFNLDDKKKTLKTFSSYDYNYINSKKKSQKECQNYLSTLQNKEKYNCKVNVQLTNNLKSSID